MGDPPEPVAWGSPSWEKEEEEGREGRLEALPRVLLLVLGLEGSPPAAVREVKEEAEAEEGVAWLPPGLLMAGTAPPPRYRAPPGEPGEGMGLPP